MSWIYLLLAIGLEVLGTSMLKVMDGLVSMKTVIMLISYVLSLLLLSLALKKLDVGVTYAIWSGLGITAIEMIGVFMFGETLNTTKIFFITLILIGTVGLSLTGNPS